MASHNMISIDAFHDELEKIAFLAEGLRAGVKDMWGSGGMLGKLNVGLTALPIAQEGLNIAKGRPDPQGRSGLERMLGLVGGTAGSIAATGALSKVPAYQRMGTIGKFLSQMAVGTAGNMAGSAIPTSLLAARRKERMYKNLLEQRQAYTPPTQPEQADLLSQGHHVQIPVTANE